MKEFFKKYVRAIKIFYETKIGFDSAIYRRMLNVTKRAEFIFGNIIKIFYTHNVPLIFIIPKKNNRNAVFPKKN